MKNLLYGSKGTNGGFGEYGGFSKGKPLHPSFFYVTKSGVG
jgi:hypothetical protein